MGSPDIFHTPDSEALQSLSLSFLTDCSFTVDECVYSQNVGRLQLACNFEGRLGFVGVAERHSSEEEEGRRGLRFRVSEKLIEGEARK